MESLLYKQIEKYCKELAAEFKRDLDENNKMIHINYEYSSVIGEGKDLFTLKIKQRNKTNKIYYKFKFNGHNVFRYSSLLRIVKSIYDIELTDNKGKLINEMLNNDLWDYDGYFQSIEFKLIYSEPKDGKKNIQGKYNPDYQMLKEY